MTIHSLPFIVFFSAVFLLYYAPFKFRDKALYQNVLLLAASYLFYGLVNWKMIPLLIAASAVYYALGIAIADAGKASAKANMLAAIGACIGIALLLYFKYLNFFIASFIDLFNLFGLRTNIHTLHIIMPLGLSFWTFKLMSYCFEVRDKTVASVRNIIPFAIYAAFFPAITAGPIDRPEKFIPQLRSERTFDYGLAVDGARQMVWGMFKKLVIADRFTIAIDGAWGAPLETAGINLLIAAFLFSVQLYADFSGYSDIAIGAGKLLALKTAKNFNYPFFARNIAEFWRNWHISLTSWLTDYVFMPLHDRFRKWGKAGVMLAISINFLLVGLWHGANWTFVALGLYHGVLYIPLIASGNFGRIPKHRVNKLGFPPLKDALQMLLTFTLVTFGMVILRANNISRWLEYLRALVFNFFPLSLSIESLQGKRILVSVALLLLEWFSFRYKMEYALCLATKFNRLWRYAAYVLIAVLISAYLFGADTQEFVYQQF
jgi:D-alanyl-lipoteichoic acid acyltransferase DltB (MBOAT superfamily)